jgi:toxin HigB-1
MCAASPRLQAIEICADVVAGQVQDLAENPLGDLRSITRCVMARHDRRISRPGNRAHLARGVQPRLAARHSVHRATEAADAEQCQVLQDLAVPPNNQLEALQGDRAGQHSIRINRQWRICFVWATGGPDRVEIVDYH